MRPGRPYTRNVFNRPTPKDLHLLMHAVDPPMIPALAGAMPALGIESLQKMGTKFMLCANALGIWCLELEARGKGKAEDIEKELRANVLPGVTIVPAMVIAIEKAQEAGIDTTVSKEQPRRHEEHEGIPPGIFFVLSCLRDSFRVLGRQDGTFALNFLARAASVVSHWISRSVPVRNRSIHSGGSTEKSIVWRPQSGRRPS